MADRDRIEQLNDALEGITPVPAAGDMRELFGIARRLRHLPNKDFKTRLKADLKEKAMSAATEIKIPAVMPYLVAQNAAKLVDFMKEAFGAQEMQRYSRPDGTIMHTALTIGDAMIELSDGSEQFPSRPVALHIYVPNTDATYERAVAAGAKTLHAPVDQFYGDREAGVEDMAGNKWYIATRLQSTSHIPEGLRTVTPYLHARGADKLIDFLKGAFGADEVAMFRDPKDGRIAHAMIRVGDTTIEMSEAHGPYPSMPIGLHYHVPDVDAVYQRAIEAGGVGKDPPSDKPYGERNSTVVDPAGNEWFIATRLPAR